MKNSQKKPQSKKSLGSNPRLLPRNEEAERKKLEYLPHNTQGFVGEDIYASSCNGGPGRALHVEPLW